MSNKQNDIFLERSLEKFDSTESGNERGRLIDALRENGFIDEADYLTARLYAERETFLEDNGLHEKDVFIDEFGNEYGIYWEENGTPGEQGYSFSKQIVSIPDKLTIK